MTYTPSLAVWLEVASEQSATLFPFLATYSFGLHRKLDEESGIE